MFKRYSARAWRTQGCYNTGEVPYTGQECRVALPSDTDPNFRWEIRRPNGQHGVHLAMFKNPKRISDITEQLDQRIVCVDMPLPMLPMAEVQWQDIFVLRGYLPNEAERREHLPPIRPERGRPFTCGDILARIIYQQKVWYGNITRHPRPIWTTYGDDKVWGTWRENPREEAVWLVAIRRTRLDNRHRVFYFPELVVRPIYHCNGPQY
ncbi:hypothetical protein GY45DRAFT_937769 [Cubamyces sp. BRFM 1775]|nr:hypothetical protein GY45DRAFT_937769 [Cubamyces sp. BRFM 1775]